MKKLVIAGANSFIGREVLRQLSSEYTIVAMVRTVEQKNDLSKQIDGNIQYIVADMSEYPKAIESIGKFDYYLPLEWAGTKREDRDRKDINHHSYELVLQSIKAAVKCGECEKIVIPGTQAVYGTIDTITDNTQPIPESEYGKAKLQLYNTAAEFCKETKTRLYELRFWNVYGKDDSNDKMINSVVCKLCRGENVHIRDGEKYWDFLHVRDAVELVKILFNTNTTRAMFNVLDGRRDSLYNFVKRAAIVCGSQSTIEVGKDVNQIDYNYHKCDISALQQQLHWTPKVLFEDGIVEMANKYRK